MGSYAKKLAAEEAVVASSACSTSPDCECAGPRVGRRSDTKSRRRCGRQQRVEGVRLPIEDPLRPCRTDWVTSRAASISGRSSRTRASGATWLEDVRRDERIADAGLRSTPPRSASRSSTPWAAGRTRRASGSASSRWRNGVVTLAGTVRQMPRSTGSWDSRRA